MPASRVPTAPTAAKRSGRPTGPLAASSSSEAPHTGRVGTAPHKGRPSPYAAPVGGPSTARGKGSAASGAGHVAARATKPRAADAPGRLPDVDHAPGVVVTSDTVPAVERRDFDDDESYGAAPTPLMAPPSIDATPRAGPSTGAGPMSPMASQGVAPSLSPGRMGTNIRPEERDAGLGPMLQSPVNRVPDAVVPETEASSPAIEPLPRGAAGLRASHERMSVRSRDTSRHGSEQFRLPSTTNVHGKAVSPFHLIQQLDALRVQCVGSGRLLEAQQCLDEMRSLAEHHGRRVARELKAPRSTEFAKRQLQERHRAQSLKFTALWEQQMAEFDSRASAAVRELRQRRQREYEDLEDVIRSNLDHQRPHFSSAVVATEKELDKLVRNAKYEEAHRLRAVLNATVEKERRKFEELKSVRLAQQTRALKRRQTAEERALDMRIQGDREQLLGQRQNDHDTLMQRQANEVIAFEQRVKTEKAKALRDIDRRLKAMQSGDGLKHFDLRVFNRIAENALADVVGAPPDRDDDGELLQQAASSRRR